MAQASVEAAAPYIPSPWGPLISLAAGLTIGLLRSAQNRSLGRRVIQSIDDRVKPTADEAMKINIAQGASGRRLVDEAQGKTLKLPF